MNQTLNPADDRKKIDWRIAAVVVAAVIGFFAVWIYKTDRQLPSATQTTHSDTSQPGPLAKKDSVTIPLQYVTILAQGGIADGNQLSKICWDIEQSTSDTTDVARLFSIVILNDSIIQYVFEREWR